VQIVLVPYCLAGALVLFLVWLALRHIEQLLEQLLQHLGVGTQTRVAAFRSTACRAVLATFAVILFVEPVVSGTAHVEIHAPDRLPTTVDHLSVQVTAVGLGGVAGGTRIVNAAFDDRGVASLDIPMLPFESRLNIDVLDGSLPNALVARRTVYVSPFVKRQVWSLEIHFQ
jgi:hypothetical protein